MEIQVNFGKTFPTYLGHAPEGGVKYAVYRIIRGSDPDPDSVLLFLGDFCFYKLQSYDFTPV